VVAAAVGITLERQDTVDVLARRLRDKHLLLVMDNCEHLVEQVAGLVSRLLAEAPRLVVLATSRERLNIEGETAWWLPPLPLPDADTSAEAAASTDAVRLFVDRARSVRPGFELDEANATAVVSVCRWLEGIPLALELAAARTSALSPADMVTRLGGRLRLLTHGARDADPRHQTLGATLDWSYHLLEQPEQTLLQRLSIFRGSLRLDVAEQVCGFTPLGPDDVVDGLQRLADKSMLQAEPAPDGTLRYRLLDTIREYAGAALAESGDAAQVRERHVVYYERLAAEAFEARLVRGAIPEHRRLWDEIAELRAALDGVHDDPEREITLLGDLRYLWVIYAQGEGLRRIRAALENRPRTSRGLVRMLWVAAALEGRAGDRNTFVSPQELAELAREVGDEAMAAVESLGLGYMAERMTGDVDAAFGHLRQAVDDLGRVGNRPDMAMALTSLGGIEMQRGNLEKARPWIQQGLDVAVAVADDYGAAGAYYTRGWLEILCGNREAARASFIAALDLVMDSDFLSIAQQAEGIAEAVRIDDPVRALSLYGGAARLREEVEAPLGLPWRNWVKPGVEAARAAVAPDRADRAFQAGRDMRREALVALARSAGKPAKGGHGGLSKRELEVARLVTSGLSNKDIAQRLFLSERTVESHVDHAMGKLGFHARSQVAAWIAEQGLATQPRD
jgi:non-specific serine/threonine protein kinase